MLAGVNEDSLHLLPSQNIAHTLTDGEELQLAKVYASHVFCACITPQFYYSVANFPEIDKLTRAADFIKQV